MICESSTLTSQKCHFRIPKVTLLKPESGTFGSNFHHFSVKNMHVLHNYSETAVCLFKNFRPVCKHFSGEILTF